MDLYISKSFSSGAPSVERRDLQSRDFILNELVFELGIMLIELSFGQPLYAYKSAKDVDSDGNDTFFTEYLIATRLVRELEHREPSRYADAANRCVLSRFETSNQDLEDPNFLRQFKNGVVVPLQELNDLLQ